VPDWLNVIVLGIVEGITEFIPVSSTGHLLLAAHYIPNAQQWKDSELFIVVIQSAAVLAIVPLFRRRFLQFCDWKNSASRDYLFKLTTSFGITGAGGLVLKKLGYELPETALPVATALLVGGLLFILVEGWLRGNVARDEITWTVAIALGGAQLLAMIFPGLSRSGSTILAALLLGTSRSAATEYSFIVGVPTMLAAGALEIFDALRDAGTQQPWLLILLGSVVSAVVSFIAVKWLLGFIQSHTFVSFGWYRVALGVILLVALLA
jgi:undecaprenyl-diphosphatase